MNKTKNLVILTITLGLTFVASTKQKRDVFETMQSAAMMGASEVASRFQEGVGFKDNSDREVNFFGAKMGGGHNFKTGFGHAVEDESRDESSERRRRNVQDEEEIIIKEKNGNMRGSHTEQTYGNLDFDQEELILVEDEGDVIVTNEDSDSKPGVKHSKTYFEPKEEEIIVVEDDYDRYGKFHQNEDDIVIVKQRNRRNIYDSEKHRFERNALRSYSLTKQSSSESISDEEYDATTPYTHASTPLQRKKRAARPCFAGRRIQPAEEDIDETEEFQQLKKSNNKYRKRSKRQTDSVSGLNSFSNSNGSDMPSDDQDERFQQFMEQMMLSVRKVAMIARKVQEAFQQPPTAPSS